MDQFAHEGMQGQGAQQIHAALVQVRDAARRTLEALQASTRGMAQLSEASQRIHAGRGRVTGEAVDL